MASEKQQPSAVPGKETLKDKGILREYKDDKIYDLTWSYVRQGPNPGGTVFPGIERFETLMEALNWIRRNLMQDQPHKIHFLSLTMLVTYRESCHGQTGGIYNPGWLKLLHFNSDADKSKWVNVGPPARLFQASDFLENKTDHTSADAFVTSAYYSSQS